MKTALIYLIQLTLVLGVSCKSPEINTKYSSPQTLSTAVAPYRAVIFGAGPQTYVRPYTVPKLYRSFRRDFPENSQFIAIENFSLGKLPELSLPPGAKVHLILNVHGMAEKGEHWIHTEKGWLKTVEVGKTMGRLYGMDNTVDVETSLITCFAGATDCSLFPGGVFGASSDHTVAYEYAFFNFIKGLEEKRYRFPMSATEMYQEYQIAERAAKKPSPLSKPTTAWRQNCNGILGLKTVSQSSKGQRMSLVPEEPKVTGVCYPLRKQEIVY